MYIIAAIAIALALGIALIRFNVWGTRPIVYQNLSAPDIAPFIRSWGPWLAERGRIVVGHASTDLEVEFRKHRYARQPDLLRFRVRNADSSKRHYATVLRALEAASVPYDLERTKKRRAARAIAVPLVAEDVHTPAAASRLLQLSFAAVGASAAGFHVRWDGHARRAPDIPARELIPHCQAQAAGFRFGTALGHMSRRLLR